MTRAHLAERVGVRPDTVRSWESGRSTPRGRNRETYAKLLAALAEPPAAGAPAPSSSSSDAGTGLDTSVSDHQHRQHRQQEEDRTRVTVRQDEQGAGAAGVANPPGSAVDSPGPTAAAASQDGTVEPSPAQAFDALYACCAPALTRQTYLLSGRRDLAAESVERAFQLAWDRWPEVARDPDPAGWVRAAAYEWALSPWHRFRRRYRQPEPPPPEEADRALLDGLLSLPPPYRRTLVLYDGVGLDLPETAAETEASTRAAAGRLMYARETLAARLPEPAGPQELHQRLAGLASTVRLPAAEPPGVRGGSERRARLVTRTAIACTVALIGATALTLATAPTQYEPPVPQGNKVQGVPPRVAPGPLSEDERELRARLQKQVPGGPERLMPRAR